ncbi:MAG: polyhydroxyalkanoate synthesis regulator DNA-binding domain-containing protein [Gemmatimonadales bacterium]
MVRLIKRYGGGSRKLYDTEESRYVSLDEIAAWVRKGQELQVVDSGTGEDVTSQTLAQVIYEDHRTGTSFLPKDFLHEVIRRGHEAISSRVEQLQTGVGSLVRAGVDKITPVTGMQEELDVLRHKLAQLEASLGELEDGRSRARRKTKKRAVRR